MMPMSHDIAETPNRCAMVWSITMHPACKVVTTRNLKLFPCEVMKCVRQGRTSYEMADFGMMPMPHDVFETPNRRAMVTWSEA